ncbi:terminase [Pseudonocardia hydrocarbonoxydans]|uniref:Terminase n=1 Tax=Pseudonocardia hydrocarbonoxydans TaxID=76726 RepID=A0A4Y3WSB4_9PSEU|nr:terminase [Pseudonocardia hydrocarbonoxydans]GEC20990.1 hypothetical protein PHY01_32730 [Pseudonocardia hydrocarbonoxydans]
MTLLGSTEPRIFTEPAGRLTRSTSRGYEVADFAEAVLGEPLLPWQRWLAIHAMELNRDGSYRFRVALATCARQSGKSHFLRVLSLYRLYVEGVRLVLGVAQDVSIAREMWSACVDTIKAVPDLTAELETVRRVNGDESFTLSGGGRYKISAANRSAGRGLSVDHLCMDEIREQRDWAAWSALSKTTMARPRAQTWAISTAGDNQSVVLRHLQEAGRSGRDPSIFYAEWSAVPGCDLDDVRAWAASNPGLGRTVSEAAIRTALGTDPPNVFRAEVLNQDVDELDGAIGADAWKACADPAGSLAHVRDRVILCLDVSPDGHHVTLAGAAVLPDGRVRVEIIGAWSSTAAARRELFGVRDVLRDPDESEGGLTDAGLVEQIAPAALAWFPSGPAGALGPELRGLGAVEVKGSEVAEACQEFADLVVARRVLHPGDPLLDAHVAGASKLHQGDSWRFTRRCVGHVDALYAAAGAAHVARTLPVERPLPRPMIV